MSEVSQKGAAAESSEKAMGGPTPGAEDDGNSPRLHQEADGMPPDSSTSTEDLSSVAQGPSTRNFSESEAGVEATRSKLDKMMKNFEDFDQSVKKGTLSRRKKGEDALNELNDEVSRLEKILAGEVTRRVELHRSLQTWAEEEISHISKQFETTLNQKMDSVHQTLNKMESRLDALEKLFEKERKQIPQNVELRNRDLTEKLKEFQEAFKKERQLRIEREGTILNKLAQNEQMLTDRFDAERNDRAKAVESLHKSLTALQREASKEQSEFQSMVKKQLAELRNTISVESLTREKEDDEIVEALNRYTTRLQQSLHLINATE